MCEGREGRHFQHGEGWVGWVGAERWSEKERVNERQRESMDFHYGGGNEIS